MKNLFDSINSILIEWNPIGVPKYIASEEYKRYIPLIINSINNHKKLICCLEDILTNKIGVEYDRRNKKHFKDIQEISENLIELYEKLRYDKNL